jgi:hypothetical protein
MLSLSNLLIRTFSINFYEYDHICIYVYIVEFSIGKMEIYMILPVCIQYGNINELISC